MTSTMKLAKVHDELDIEQFVAECLLMGVHPRRKLVTRRDELRPSRAEQKTPTGLRSHLCEEGHDVERVTVQSDVVMQTDQRRKNDHCHVQSRDHLAEEVHDPLDSHVVKILALKHPGNTTTPKATDKTATLNRMQRFQDGRGEALQRGGELE